MSLYLGIDPAGKAGTRGHTGIVLIEAGDNPARLVDSWAVRGSVEGFYDWSSEHEHFWVPELAKSYFDDITVIVEQFVDMQIMGADRSPLLIEGAVRFLRPDAVLSPPSGYKKAVPDEVLKRMGFWFTGDNHNDRNSAARHVLRHLRKNHLPTAEAGWGHIRKGST